MNALIPLVCAVILGGGAWWLVDEYIPYRFHGVAMRAVICLACFGLGFWAGFSWRVA